ncbi:hypothetical protein NDU88_003196 [Pleurodeles waltl]|uniref:Uncharacterized protein n=1 Tax=Pleurodeles waltl TaxID=8319 RepID=A0AAV7Q8A7_PLEWA|nr:hypothetical protein NDU88_003196 [Pleurodeles waltl]
MRRSASSFPSAAAAASSLVSPLRSSVLAEPGRPKRARTPGLSVCGERSGTAPSVAAVWPQIQRLSAWVLVGGAGEPLPLRRHHVAPFVMFLMFNYLLSNGK